MGILRQLFVKAPIEAGYLCDRCDQVLEDPLNLEPCDHTFCKSCIVSAADTLPAKCPVLGCRQPVIGHRKASRKYLSLLNQLVLMCPAEEGEAGCDWRGQLGDLDAHRRDCEYNLDKTITCDQRGCGAKFTRREKDNHNCLEYMREQLNRTQEKLEKTRKRVRELDPEADSSSSSSAEEEEEEDEEVVVVASTRSTSSSRSKPKPKQMKTAAATASASPSRPNQSTSAAAAAAMAIRSPPTANNNNNGHHSRDNDNDNVPQRNLQIVYQTLPSTSTTKKGKKGMKGQKLAPLQLDWFQFGFSTTTKSTKFKTPLLASNTGYRFLSSTIRHENKFYSIGGTLNTRAKSEVGTTIIFEEGTMEGVAGPMTKEKRKEFGVTVLGNTIYVVGGCEGIQAMNCVEILKLDNTDRRPKWEDAKDFLNTPRGALSSNSLAGRVYAIGGVGDGDTSFASVEVYDPARGKWAKGPHLLAARGFHKSIVVGGRIYALGGRDLGGRTISSGEWYDPREGRWTAGASMNEPRREFGLVSNNNGLIYAIGGSQTQAPHFRAGGDPTMEFYDERADKWELMDYPDNLNKNVDWMSMC